MRVLGHDLSRLRSEQRARLSQALIKVSQSPNPTVRTSYRFTRQLARDAGSRVTGRQLGWVAHLRSARWIGPTRFELAGWAYERGFGHVDSPPTTEVWLESAGHRVPAEVELRPDPEVNGAARNGEFDYANTAFVARFDLTPLLALVDDATVSEGWVVRIRVRGAGRDRTGTFRSRYRLGSVRHLFAATQGDDVQLLPSFSAVGDGLRFACRRRQVMAREVSFSGREVHVRITATGPELVGASLQTDVQLAPLSCRADGTDDSGRAVFVVEGTVPDHVPVIDGAVPLSVSRQLLVHGADQVTYPVGTALDDAAPEIVPDSALLASSTPNGNLIVLDAPARVLVDECELEQRPLGFRLSGRYLMGDLARSGELPRLAFEGAWQELPVDPGFRPTGEGRGTWSAFVPLLVSVWDREPLPPRQGGYVLRASTTGGARMPVSAVPAVTARTPKEYAQEGFRLRTQTGGGRSLRFRVSVPRRADELGSFHQRRLERSSRNGRWAPRNAVYFESFYGRAATCNPNAIDREIATHYPQLTRFWGVVDASIPIPDGAIKVVRGTREWWHARATSRYVVANDWLRRTFTPQPFQVVLQTWHGSMLKRIGLDRPNQPAAKLAIIRTERAKWDALLAQNHHSTEILRSAYDWHDTMFEEGYPRNDPLTPGSPYAGDGATIRSRLGIRPEQTAVLYAPTWRENLTTMVTFLDLEKLTADLGPDYVVLLRGHSRTVAFGESVDDLPGIIDVTTYPEVTELFLAADALITDYSSVMFDFSVTRRPMIFFVPDMADYRDSGRGVYFDLSEVAPGPVLSTQDEVTEAIRELDLAGERYATAYQTWLARFNHLDDGYSAARVVRRLLAIRK